MKRLLAFLLSAALLCTLCACAGKDSGSGSRLDGTMAELCVSITENAELSDEVRESFKDYATAEVTTADEEYLLGAAGLAYTDSVVFYPMINVIPFQMILLRMDKNADIDATVKVIEDNANPHKWVCVEAEKVLVKSIGDVIIFIMGEKETVDALYASAQSLAKK